jgi:hypothetical protein
MDTTADSVSGKVERAATAVGRGLKRSADRHLPDGDLPDRPQRNRHGRETAIRY